MELHIVLTEYFHFQYNYPNSKPLLELAVLTLSFSLKHLTLPAENEGPHY